MIGHTIVHWSLMALQQTAPLNPTEMTKDQLDREIALEALKHSGPGGGAVAIIIPLAFFAFVVTLAWFGSRRKQVQIRATAELHKQLLDKFGSGREFAEFLESAGGQRFLDEMWSRESGTRAQILKAVRTGIILTVLGLGLFGIAWVDAKERASFLILAFPTLSVGVGFLIAAAVSHHLTKKWGPDTRAGAGNALAS